MAVKPACVCTLFITAMMMMMMMMSGQEAAGAVYYKLQGRAARDANAERLHKDRSRVEHLSSGAPAGLPRPPRCIYSARDGSSTTLGRLR